jgi:predicted RNase H-like nuclease
MLRFVGVDGCRSGWLSVALDGDGGWDIAVHETFPELWRAHQGADHILVDVPIGLRSDGSEERACDKQARRLLGSPRGSSVFPAPCRPALAAEDHEEASRINRLRTGRGLSVQSWAIAPKIDEVDRFLRSNAGARRAVREVHPEVLFWGLNGGVPVATKKKRTVGFQERFTILSHLNPLTDAIVSHGLSRWRRSEVARDDILDALAAAVTAELGRGDFETVPRDPEQDARGLPMEMVYFRPAHMGKGGAE